MARKYGIVNVSDVKIAPTRGANFSTGVVHMPRKPVRPVMSRAPQMVRPGQGGIGHALWQAATAVGQQQMKTRARQQAQERGDAMQQHPSMRSQGAVASNTGGNPVGAVREQPGAVQQPPMGEYYQAPRNMGAKVPASRMAKFAQGRGLWQ